MRPSNANNNESREFSSNEDVINMDVDLVDSKQVDQIKKVADTGNIMENSITPCLPGIQVFKNIGKKN